MKTKDPYDFFDTFISILGILALLAHCDCERHPQHKISYSSFLCLGENILRFPRLNVSLVLTETFAYINNFFVIMS